MKIVLVLFWLFCAVSLTSQHVPNSKSWNLRSGGTVKFHSKCFTKQAQRMKLSDYKKCFSLSYNQFVTMYKVHDREIQNNVSYEKLDSVTRVSLPGGQYFHFKEDKLLLIYISGEEAVKSVWNEFKNATSSASPEKKVRSRAGKTSNQLIYASQGVTASTDKNEVHFIEIYPPCSVEDYLKHIYEEPQRFIR